MTTEEMLSKLRHVADSRFLPQLRLIAARLEALEAVAVACSAKLGLNVNRPGIYEESDDKMEAVAAAMRNVLATGWTPGRGE